MSLKYFDWSLFFCVILLLSFSSLAQLSIAKDTFPQHLLFIFLGLVLFFLFSQINVALLFPFKNILYFLSVLSLLITYIIGTEVRGSVRWLSIGSTGIQPSEIIKPLIIIFLASFIGAKNRNVKNTLILLLSFLPILFLVFKQPDLGNTVVYLVIILLMLISEGYHYLIGMIILFVGSLAPFLWNILHDYQKKRILIFLNPSIDPQGTGYNAVQATISVGNGGIFGRGLGSGTQSHLEFLPERHTDFVFAAFAEEFGFLGSLLIIAVYLFLLLRILKIAVNAQNRVVSLFVIGVFAMIFVQVFINIGMNIGLIPITGITLPLMSYGGSSLITTMISLGLVESIAISSRKEEIVKIG